MSALSRQAPLVGAALVAVYTGAVTISDAFTKHLATQFAAPQVLTICSATILVIIVLSALSRRRVFAVRTSCPRAMALRSVMTVFAAVLFYYAFALLPFADVFLFIAMVPIMAGLMSAPILRERVKPLSWVALFLGSFGVYLLFPGGLSGVVTGHVVAFFATLCGTLAIVMARYIARVEDNPLALVFYPQLAILLTMGAVSPLVWQPIHGVELLYAVLCGATMRSQ